MKKSLISFAFFCLMRTFIVSAQTLDQGIKELATQIANEMSEGNRQKIAVVEFSDLDGKITELGKFLSEELITKLFASKKFNVVERQLLNKVLYEYKLNLTGLIDETTAKQIGKILGVDAICSGTITDLVNSVKINARLISTETGSIFSVASAQIQKDEVVKKLLDNIPSTSDKPSITEMPGSQSAGKTIDEMAVIDGTWTRKPDTVIREKKYPDALYFNNEKIVVRLLQNYKKLTMKVGVDDQAGLKGSKRFWIRDHKGNSLFEAKAYPNAVPINVDLDISRADLIEINALDYNTETPIYIRWIDVRFLQK